MSISVDNPWKSYKTPRGYAFYDLSIDLLKELLSIAKDLHVSHYTKTYELLYFEFHFLSFEFYLVIVLCILDHFFSSAAFF